MKYEIFISYSRKDTAVADEICAALTRAGISYFIDRQDNPDDLEIPAVLADAIVNSRIFLLLASENSYASKFVNAEITFAFNKLPRRSIVPYIIDGSDMPLSMRFIFSTINWRDRRTHPIEPKLIADLCGLLGRVVPTERRTVDFDAVEYFEIGRGHTRGITALAITRSADVIASGSDDGSVCLWDMFMGEQKGTPFIYGDGDEVNTVALTPDGNVLAVSGYHGTDLWDTDSHVLICHLAGNHSAFSPDGRMLAVTDKDTLNIYSTDGFRLANSIKIPVLGEYNTLCSLAFAPDNASVAVGDMTGHVWLRDCHTGRNPVGKRCFDLDHSCSISSAVITPNGRNLVVSSSLGITCWPLGGGASGFIKSDDVVESVSVSPDGYYCASADYAGAFKIYGLTTENLLFERRLVNVNRVLYSPDGEFVVSGDCFGNVAVWTLKQN